MLCQLAAIFALFDSISITTNDISVSVSVCASLSVCVCALRSTVTHRALYRALDFPFFFFFFAHLFDSISLSFQIFENCRRLMRHATSGSQLINDYQYYLHYLDYLFFCTRCLPGLAWASFGPFRY